MSPLLKRGHKHFELDLRRTRVAQGAGTVGSAVLSGRGANEANALRTAHTTGSELSHHGAETADDFLQTSGDLA
jgi:hypothetical protein